MKQNAAILIFSRTAQAEAARKKLHSNRVQNMRLHQALLHHTKLAATSTGLPVFLHSEKQQAGNSFGQNFVQAIESVFAKGYSKIIAVGGDCAELTATHIHQSLDYLNADTQPIGKDARGGIYLVGVDKKLFDAKAFENLPWLTHHVGDALEKLYHTYHPVALLQDELKDLNETTDILRHIKNGCTAFVRLLKSIFLPSHVTRRSPALLHSVDGFNIVSRGPPLIN